MTITPRFEANIGADISKFMQKANEVDAKIRELATGVVVDISANIQNFMSDASRVQDTINDIDRTVDVTVNGNTSDLERAIAEANAHIATLNDSATININGNNSNFNSAAGNVNRTTRSLSRRVTEARIGADIGDFERQMVDVVRALTDADDTVTPQIELDINEFQRDILTVEDRMREVARSTTDPNVEADIAGFMAQMALVQATLNGVIQTHDIDIRADTGSAMARISLLWLQLKALTVRDFVINIRAAWSNYQSTMGALAAFSRNFSEITGMVAGGIKVAMSPAIVPVIASLVGLLGQLGPMLGTIAGSSFALVTAFAAAGIGVAGFAAVAIPTIKDFHAKVTEMNDLEASLETARLEGDVEKIAELSNKMQELQDGMTDSQERAQNALSGLSGKYDELTQAMAPGVLNAYSSAMEAVTTMLEMATPMISATVDTVQRLMDAFNRNLETADVEAFFEFLNTNAASSLQVIIEAIGNFMQGIFNLMTAFGPLAVETQGGFLAMSEGFREWSASLGENKKFQQFVDYVSENMPKIRSIFSDAIQGIIDMFAAFAPSSSDMMTGLQDMMERFKEWSAALSEDKGFKGFIDYIKTNGPVVLSAIGGLVDFIINVGKAAAPTGEYLLGLIDRFLDWSNAMLEAHPWLGKLAIGAVVVTGALMAITAPILLVNALFGKMIVAIVKTVAKMVWGAAVFVTKWAWIALKATLHALKVAAAWTLATGKAMVVAVAKMIASAAVFVAKWLWMGVQALLHAAKVAAAWVLATGTAMVVALAKMVASAAVFVAKWLWMGAQALLHAAKVVAAWALSTGIAMVTALAKMVATAAVFVAKWIWMGVQALLAAARMAAAWFIALGPIGWVIAAIVGLVALIIIYWDEIVAWTKKAWTATWGWIKDTWEKIKSKTVEVATSMWNTIKEKFAAIVSSVKEKMASAKEAISNKWEEIKATAATKLANLVESVTEFFSDLVEKVREKMGDAVDAVGEFIGEMPGKVTSFVSDMVQAGADLVGGVISGIKGKISEGLGVIGGLATSLIARFKSDTDTHSPSRAFADIAKWFAPGIVRGLNSTSGQALDAVSALSGNLTNAFNPQLAMADMRASATLDTSISRADMGVVRKSFAAEVGDVDVNQGDTVLQINSREFARWTADDIKKENDRNSKQRNVSRRGHN